MPEFVIPDNEKPAVREASRFEPDLNPTYQEVGIHHGTIVLTERPVSAGQGEGGGCGQNLERRFMVPLRNQTFLSLGELRKAIRPRFHGAERAAVREDRRQPPELA